MNRTFIEACTRKPVEFTPVWYMRQAGRYQPEYRKIREKYTLLDICRNPEVCVEVTRLPITQLGVDAAILFSDIMVPLGPMGVQFDIKENVGPVIENPIRSGADVEKLRFFNAAEELPYVLETIKLLRQELSVPLIGFTGGPFTLASYMIEGGPSRDYLKTKRLMVSEPQVWALLMDRLADMIIHYLGAQIEAGARAVQIFDSWVGSLNPTDYEQYVLPTMKKIFSQVGTHNVPMIYFGVTTGELLSTFTETGASVIGVDWRTPLASARNRVGRDFAIQGNLDPAMLLGPWPEIEKRARAIIDEGLEHSGFVFNLGHGVNPSVQVDTLRQLTQFVHDYSSQVIQSRHK